MIKTNNDFVKIKNIFSELGIQRGGQYCPTPGEQVIRNHIKVSKH